MPKVPEQAWEDCEAVLLATVEAFVRASGVGWGSVVVEELTRPKWAVSVRGGCVLRAVLRPVRRQVRVLVATPDVLDVVAAGLPRGVSVAVDREWLRGGCTAVGPFGIEDAGGVGRSLGRWYAGAFDGG